MDELLMKVIIKAWIQVSGIGEGALWRCVFDVCGAGREKAGRRLASLCATASSIRFKTDFAVAGREAEVDVVGGC
jgi:hypothetical protein